MNESRPKSMSSFWMPFTNNRDFKASPRLLVSAEGMYYKDVDGNSVLDGTAGLWCVPCGHASVWARWLRMLQPWLQNPVSVASLLSPVAEYQPTHKKPGR